jgi:leader peptidase (prepilin peptidase)/N-methyltransferase
MVGSCVCAGMAAALTGTVITPVLAVRGLAQLIPQDAVPGGMRLAAAFRGAVAGVVAMATSHGTANWWLAPALLVWGCALVAAACCDAVTQRIPTPLVRQAGIVTCALLSVALGIQSDWLGMALSGVAAVGSGLTLLVCWRFAGAGFGDVRLATLGGLGLGHATHRGLLVALAAFALITVTQAAITLMRGGAAGAPFPTALPSQSASCSRPASDVHPGSLSVEFVEQGLRHSSRASDRTTGPAQLHNARRRPVTLHGVSREPNDFLSPSRASATGSFSRRSASLVADSCRYLALACSAGPDRSARRTTREVRHGQPR